MKVHPAAMAFPRMPPDEFNELKENIKANGIQIPLLVNKKKDTILDGRNRFTAAHDLKLPDSKIPLEVFNGTDEEAVQAIVARNIIRRHLTDDQRVALTAKLLGKTIEKEAAQDRASGRSVKGKGKGTAVARIAKVAKVSEHKGRAALETAKGSPADLDAVIEGKQKLSTAKKKARAKSGKTPKTKAPKSLQEQVQAKFLRLMESFSVQQYREVRKILRELLDTEEK